MKSPHLPRLFLYPLAFVVAALLFAAPAARASSVAHLTPEKVLAQADVIFQGTVIASKNGWSNSRQVFATTIYTLHIDRIVLDRDGWLAARTTGEAVSLSFLGGTQDGFRYRVSGIPTLAVGESAFFFMSGDDLRSNSMSPVIGLSEGLYRIKSTDGSPKVFTPGGCSGAERPVDFRFFEKFRNPGVTYSPAAFAAEITRALPIAAANPDLRIIASSRPQQIPGRSFGPGQHQPQTVTSQPATFGANVVPASPAAMAIPQLAQRTLVEAELDFIESARPVWGQFSNEPDYPIVFNVPPGMWWTDDFQLQQANWNAYATGVFRFFTNSNNLFGWPNGRFETAFINNAQFNDLYGSSWGANTLGICTSREAVFNDRIVEADIAFNTAFMFTDDPNVTYANPSIYSIRQVALHELGHAFGRSHSWESNPSYLYPTTLNYFPDGFFQAEAGRVFADDSESIRSAYVAQGINQTDFGITLWCMSGSIVSGVNGVRTLSMPDSALQGGYIPVSNIWLENIGTNTRATTIDWYLDPTPRDFNLADAYYCQSTPVGFLNRFNGVQVTSIVQAPQAIPTGNYYLCAVLAESDSNSNNNFAWSERTVRIDYNPAFDPPANDSRNSPRAISLGTVTGSTFYATNDGSTTCGASNTSPDVWFTFNAPYSGTLNLDTCNSSFDTNLSIEERQFWFTVYRYVSIGCNDDGTCANTLNSSLSVPVTAGATYRIRLAGYNGARGNYSLSLSLNPQNDLCSGAVPITAGTFTASLYGATPTGTGSCGLTQSTPDVWFSYQTPPGCGTVTFDTYGSNFDTVLEVWPSCPSASNAPIDCNDDCSTVGPSCLTINTAPNTTLRVRVTHYGGTPPAGNFIVLNVSNPSPANDVCTNAVSLSDGDHPFDTSCGNADLLPLPAACASTTSINDFWYSYTAPINGMLQLTTTADFPMAIALYPGYACPGDPEQAIACQLGFAGASLSAGVVAGETYLVRIGGSIQPGFPNPVGSGLLSITTSESTPDNDACEAARPIYPGQSLAESLALATPDGSSLSDRVPGGPDVWYTFTAPADGTFRVSTCTSLINYALDTVVSIHSVCPGDTATELASSDLLGAGCPALDPLTIDPQDAEVELAVSAGLSYLIRIAATDPALVGSGIFLVFFDFTTPSNTCALPAIASEGDNTFSTLGATPDGPAHECFDGTEADIWFVYTATCTATTRISTCAQPYDTKLAVYAVACPAPEDAPLACNDNDGVDCAGFPASLDFSTVAGQTYFVRIGGDVPSPQTFTITCLSTPPSNDACGSGVPIADGASPFVTTLGATPDGPADSCFDGSENDVWYTYEASCSGTLQVSLCGDGADSKLAVYAETTCPTTEPLACNDNNGPVCPGPSASLELSVTAGTSYQLRIAIADDAAHTLTISCTPASTCPGDFDSDADTDSDDIILFFSAWDSGDNAADVDGDEDVDSDDVLVFFGSWDQGC